MLSNHIKARADLTIYMFGGACWPHPDLIKKVILSPLLLTLPLSFLSWDGQAGCDQVGAQLVPREKAGWTDPASLLPAQKRTSYLPLGKGGNATDFSFLSSAAERQFLMVSSSCSSHLSEPHWGMWQWMTNLAASPLDWLTAAGTWEKNAAGYFLCLPLKPGVRLNLLCPP